MCGQFCYGAISFLCQPQVRAVVVIGQELQALGAAQDAEARGEAISTLAKSAKYDFYAIGAMIRLAPSSTVHIDANIAGERIEIADGWRGDRFTPVTVEDPR